MAAQGKSTGLQVGLIIAVVVALIAAVAAFILYRNDQQNAARYASIDREKQNVQSAAERARQELSEVKRVLGITATETGAGADPAGDTVLGIANARIAALSDGGNATSVLEVAETLDAQLAAARTKESQLALEKAQLEQQYRQLERQFNEKAQQFSDVATRANADLSDVQAGAEEKITDSNRSRLEAEDALTALRAELQETKDRFQNQVRSLEDERDDLIRINQRLLAANEANDSKQFTSADGEVVRVEPRTETIYVDLGRNDQIRPGVTFSVYDKNEVGPNGGDRSALKGAIEILNVGNSLSEARILQDDYKNPISAGDPIFSPVWSRGQAGKFAFVGLIDLDGDGQTAGERDRLRRILDDAGSEFSVYIDDDGNWVDGDGDDSVDRPLDQQTEMLVIGEIPPADELTSESDRAKAEKMRVALKELQSQARRNGIPVKSLKVFLDSIGYQPKRRRYVPGQDADFNLKRGGNSRSADPNPGSTTSGLFSPDERRRGRTDQRLPSDRFRTGGASGGN